MPEQTNKDHLSVSCLIDYLKWQKDTDLRQAAENLSSYWTLQMEEGNTSNLPTTVQYTHGVGNLAAMIAQHNYRTAILFDSQEAIDFAFELNNERPKSFITIIDQPIPINEVSFPMSPDGNGWKNAILDDVVQFVEGDMQLIALLKAIYLTMQDKSKLIVRIPKLAKQAWNREYNSTVVTESIEKQSVRKYTRTITSHGEIELRSSETLYDFAAGDLHESARAANFRPTRDLGLDPSLWCCYDKV